MNAVILGLALKDCDGIYPRTRDGRCQGCGTHSDNEKDHRDKHSVASARTKDAEAILAELKKT